MAAALIVDPSPALLALLVVLTLAPASVGACVVSRHLLHVAGGCGARYFGCWPALAPPQLARSDQRAEIKKRIRSFAASQEAA
jgi:hypothetical protein